MRLAAPERKYIPIDGRAAGFRVERNLSTVCVQIRRSGIVQAIQAPTVVKHATVKNAA
jgi:hypothetical protein